MHLNQVLFKYIRKRLWNHGKDSGMTGHTYKRIEPKPVVAVRPAEKEQGFWLVSDIVPKEVITACTDTCDRKNRCILSARRGLATAAAIHTHYNSEGQLIVEDRNKQDVQVCCKFCWKEWTVDYKVEYPSVCRKQLAEYIGSNPITRSKSFILMRV